MANRFTLDRYASDALPGFGRAFSGAVDSYESAIDRERRREREDELMAREQDELARRDKMEQLRRQALGLDGVQGLVAEQQTDEMYGPAGETAFTTEDIMASGPSLVPSPEDVLASALDQETMMSDRQDLAEAGVDTPEKKKDLAEFARVVAETPDEELAGVVQERVERGVAEGRDMRDTAELIGKTPEEVREGVDAASMIVDRQALREMYALDPKGTADFVKNVEGRGDNLSVRLREFETWQKMPEGKDKEALGRVIGAVSKTPSFEDRLLYETRKEGMRTGEFEKREAIKSDREIKTEIRKLKENPEKQLEMALKNADLIRERSNIKAANIEAKDSIAVLDRLAGADLDRVYGRGESIYPDLLRSQEGIDMIADRDQLVSLLKLAGRGKLKGQGTVSDMEAKMLGDAATILGNPDISAEAAKRELDRIRPIFEEKIAIGERSEAALQQTAPVAGEAQESQNTGAPKVGTEEDGYRFLGGNPADPNNWEAL